MIGLSLLFALGLFYPEEPIPKPYVPPSAPPRGILRGHA